jgi:hypothetical protein
MLNSLDRGVFETPEFDISVKLSAMMGSPDLDFVLTGSRFFLPRMYHQRNSVNGDNRDWDFFIQETPESKAWLEKNRFALIWNSETGFTEQDPEKRVGDGSYHFITQDCVTHYRYSSQVGPMPFSPATTSHIDVQVMSNAALKLAIQQELSDNVTLRQMLGEPESSKQMKRDIWATAYKLAKMNEG